MACQAGLLSAEPQPIRNVMLSNKAGPVAPKAALTASTAASTAMKIVLPLSNFLRSRVSAKTPAGSDRKNTGSRLAVCTRAMSEALRSIRSHWVATVCIHEPMFEPSWASHRMRNVRYDRGVHGDPDPEAAADPDPGPAPAPGGGAGTGAGWLIAARRRGRARGGSRSPPGPAPP